jgi:nicotinamide phosphoribosyltransferase
MKATYVEVNGEGREIFKDPITDDGTKKSATGLLVVYDNYEGGLTLIDKASWESEGQGRLKTIYENGKFYNTTTLTQIKERIKTNK